MSERRITVAPTDELGAERVSDLIALCAAAFGKPFEAIWSRVGPGLHVVSEVGGHPVSHAMIVDRRMYIGHEADLAIDAGYVEHVATLPAFQGQGHGTATMGRVGEIVREEYEIGALATRDNSFYERLGWEAWRGLTGVRMPDGERVRSPDHDSEIMILRTERTPRSLDLSGSVFVDWREGESW